MKIWSKKKGRYVCSKYKGRKCHCKKRGSKISRRKRLLGLSMAGVQAAYRGQTEAKSAV